MDEDLAEKEELQKVIRKSVEMLPEKYRAPIWMVLYEGFTYPEVAAVLALPEKTVRTQVARGLDRLKEILGPVGSVLSLDAIALLMKQSSLEGLPIATKKIIESPDLYHTIESKMLVAAKSSQRFLAAKPSLFLYKSTTLCTKLVREDLSTGKPSNHLKRKPKGESNNSFLPK